MSRLIKRLELERMQGSRALLNYSNFDYWVHWDDIIDIVEDYEQPQLNKNQRIVLDYLKYRFNHQPYMLKQSVLSSIDDLLSDCDDDDVNDAIFTFEPKDEIDVFQAFSQWALEQEG